MSLLFRRHAGDEADSDIHSNGTVGLPQSDADATSFSLSGRGHIPCASLRGCLYCGHASGKYVHNQVSSKRCPGSLSHLHLGINNYLRALVFAAGLITGFNMFAGRELDYESETAFRGAREVLDFLALQSPQAAHYAGILTLLSNAITKKRENMASRGRSKYVGRLFRLGSTKDDGEESRRSGTDSDSTVLASASEQGETGGDISWLIDQQKHMPIDMEGGELLLGWDSLDLPQWDNFPLLSPRSLELG